jgi:hypothetical protein
MFGILTVCLEPGAKPADDRDAYNQLKSKLGLTGDDIDDVYGAMPLVKAHPLIAEHAPPNSYLILVSIKGIQELERAKPKHPNVVGWHHAAMVPSGGGPKALSPEQVEQLKQLRKPKGPRP